MRLKIFLLAFIVLIPIMGFAQAASITISSEGGDRFLLFLNSVQQNKEPQANIRVDGLSQPNYEVKVVFEHNDKGQIERNIGVSDATSSAPADVVYKIKENRGEMELLYFSAQPAQPNYTPAPGVYVVHFSQSGQAPAATQPVNNPANGSVTIGYGVGMNTDVQGQGGGVGITAITPANAATTTNTSNGQQIIPSPPCQSPMAGSSFKSAKETVANANFEETKLSTAKGILAANCVTTEQVIQICKLFGFEQSKLDFAKSAYSKTMDPRNYSKVSNVFSFDASKTNLDNFISKGGK